MESRLISTLVQFVCRCVTYVHWGSATGVHSPAEILQTHNKVRFCNNSEIYTLISKFTVFSLEYIQRTKRDCLNWRLEHFLRSIFYLQFLVERVPLCSLHTYNRFEISASFSLLLPNLPQSRHRFGCLKAQTPIYQFTLNYRTLNPGSNS